MPKKNTYGNQTDLIKATAANGFDGLKMANIFFESGLFKYAEPDFTAFNMLHTAPPPRNDPLYNLQWAHLNDGSAKQFNVQSFCVSQFNGNALNNSVQLNWKVSNEIRFAGYEIQRSTDAISFTKIGFLQSRSVSTVTNYQFDDGQLPNSQQLFYRLKMIDQDGRFSYSSIIRIKLTGHLNNRIITIAPNPFVNGLTLQLQSAGNQNIQLQLLDMSGKLLKETRYPILPGTNQLYLQAGDLLKGIYLLKLLTANGVITEKVMKQ